MCAVFSTFNRGFFFPLRRKFTLFFPMSRVNRFDSSSSLGGWVSPVGSAFTRTGVSASAASSSNGKLRCHGVLRVTLSCTGGGRRERWSLMHLLHTATAESGTHGVLSALHIKHVRPLVHSLGWMIGTYMRRRFEISRRRAIAMYVLICIALHCRC